MHSFFQAHSTPSPDDSYDQSRDRPEVRFARDAVERLWEANHEFLDPALPLHARACFDQRVWELVLADFLRRRGVSLQTWEERGRSRDAEGPDLVATDGTYFEATIATGGSGPDGVPEFELAEHVAPQEKILLRLTNAFCTKLSQRNRWISDGHIDPSRPFVIAINSPDVPRASSRVEISPVARALFGLGEEAFQFDLATDRHVGTSIGVKDSILKQSGRPVSTRWLLDPESSGVSAVLYNVSNAWNLWNASFLTLTVVHNPLATSPLKTSLCQEHNDQEYWMEPGRLRRKFGPG